MLDLLHEILVTLAEFSIWVFEIVGVLVILATGIVGVVSYLRRDVYTRLNLVKGLAMGLEFKLGSEILRTVIVRDLSEIAIVGGVILLRGVLTFLIHWEIKTEESNHMRIKSEMNLRNLEDFNDLKKESSEEKSKTKTEAKV